MLLALAALVLLCASPSMPSSTGPPSPLPYVGQDAEGNIVVNSSARVLLNGVDVLQTLGMEGEALAAQLAGVRELRVELEEIKRNSPYGKLYLIGGSTINDTLGLVTNVDRFDGTTWTKGPDLALARTAHAAAVYNSYIYVACGVSVSHATRLRLVERFDGFTWESAPPTLAARRNPGMLVADGRLYLFAGSDDTSVERFNGTGWLAAPNMTTVRESPAACVFGGYIYVAGGISPSGTFLATVERFDGRREWAPVASMNANRAGALLLSFLGRMYLLGGSQVNVAGQPAQAVTTVEEFNGTVWTPALSTIFAHGDGAGTVYGAFAYIMGGYTVFRPDSKVERFDGTSWQSLNATLTSPRVNAVAVVY
jgi:hypothetical protein